MTTNRLAKPVAAAIDNPLTDPVVARRWAGWARDKGDGVRAALWEQHARKIESGLA